MERRLIKAATFSSSKWAWVNTAAPGLVLVRCSIGRYGEEEDLQRDDDELIAAVADEFADATGTPENPVDSRVTRWGGALPQYAVGHNERVTRVLAALDAAPGLAVCGAAYDGVGIPAIAGRNRRRCAFCGACASRNNDLMAEERSVKPKARELNAILRYTMWSVFRVSGALPRIGPQSPMRSSSSPSS